MGRPSKKMRPLAFVTGRLNDKYYVSTLETVLGYSAYAAFGIVFIAMLPYYMMNEISVVDTVSSLKILDGYECKIQAVLNGNPLGATFDTGLTVGAAFTAICPNVPTKTGIPAGTANGCCGSSGVTRTDFMNVYFENKADCLKELGNM